MNKIKNNILSTLAVAMFVIANSSSSYAVDINSPNFTGTASTTFTSGLTVRTERDCSNLDGYSITLPGLGTYKDGSGEGCATTLTDNYGNTTTKALSRSSGQGDDGTMNFDSGDIVHASQKAFTEIRGVTSGGLRVGLSFTGFVDPALDITDPTYAPLTNKAKNHFQSGIDVLDAYITGSTDMADGNYIDWTVGRHALNWGEATFIPIGMNGLTMNSLDLSKLRAPGASIREALLPTEQVTVSMPLGDNASLEAFYQFSHDPVVLDAAGSFFGSEIVGVGGDKFITNGNYNKENRNFDNCEYSATGTDTAACDADLVATLNTTAGIQANNTNYLITQGLKGLTQTEAATGSGAGAAHQFGTFRDGTTDLDTMAAAAWTDLYTATLNTFLGSTTAEIASATSGAAVVGTGAGGVNKTFYTTNDIGYTSVLSAGILKNSYQSAATGLGLGDTTGANLYASLQDMRLSTEDGLNTYATVSVRRDPSGFIQEARDDGQFGLKVSGYVDQGNGLDWSLNYSRFHSKAPYVQVKGKRGIYAGDIYGIVKTAGDTASGSRTTAQANIVKAIENGAYSAGVCNATLSAGVASSTYTGYDSGGAQMSAGQLLAKNYAGVAGNYFAGNMTSAQKALADQFTWQETINGELVHNAAKCYATAEQFNALSTAAEAAGDIDVVENFHTTLYDNTEILLSALVPLNSATYQLVYPEDLNAFGVSFNTNIAGSTVQGEVTYRPDFPLAHNPSDQVQQIGDASGAFDLIDMYAYNAVMNLNNFNTNNDGTDLDDIVAGVTVSPNFYNPDTTGMTAVEIAQQNIRMYMVGMATVDMATGAFTVPGGGLELGSAGVSTYKNWMASENGRTASILGLLGIKKGIFDVAYNAVCLTAESEATCLADQYQGSYDSNYYTGTLAPTVGAAYEFGTVMFNRSSLPAISMATSSASDYLATAYTEKDVWSFDLGTTTAFAASHPVTASLGADSSALLTEVGIVHIDGLDNAAHGYIMRSGYQEGIGNEKCLGPFGALVAGGYTFGGAAAALSHLGAGQVDGLFGNGGYCESQSGATSTALTYRVIGTATYNNVANSPWSLNPTIVWSHDPKGYGPASLGGFVEDRMSMALGLRASKGDSLSASVNYTSHLHGPEIASSSDRDFVSMSVSYSF